MLTHFDAYVSPFFVCPRCGTRLQTGDPIDELTVENSRGNTRDYRLERVTCPNDECPTNYAYTRASTAHSVTGGVDVGELVAPIIPDETDPTHLHRCHHPNCRGTATVARFDLTQPQTHIYCFQHAGDEYDFYHDPYPYDELGEYIATLGRKQRLDITERNAATPDLEPHSDSTADTTTAVDAHRTPTPNSTPTVSPQPVTTDDQPDTDTRREQLTPHDYTAPKDAGSDYQWACPVCGERCEVDYELIGPAKSGAVDGTADCTYCAWDGDILDTVRPTAD